MNANQLTPNVVQEMQHETKKRRTWTDHRNWNKNNAVLCYGTFI